MSNDAIPEPPTIRLERPIRPDQKTVDLVEQLRPIVESHGPDRFEIATSYLLSLFRLDEEQQHREIRDDNRRFGEALARLDGAAFMAQVRADEMRRQRKKSEEERTGRRGL